MRPGPGDLVVWDTALPALACDQAHRYSELHRPVPHPRWGQSKRMTIGQHGPLLTFDRAKRQARGVLDYRRGERTPSPSVGLSAKHPRCGSSRKTTWRSMPAQKAAEERAGRPRDARQHRPAKARVAKGSCRWQTRDRGPACRNAGSALPGESSRRPCSKKMFNLAIQWGWRGNNPVKGIRRYDEQKRHRWLQDDELQRLVRVLDEHPNQRAANAVAFNCSPVLVWVRC